MNISMIGMINYRLQPVNILADCAQASLSCTKKHIVENFEDKVINILDYNRKDSQEVLIEIQLENATLNCLINQDGFCYKTYLFLDDISNLGAYIDYCDNNYTKQSTPNIWHNQRGYVCLNDYKDDLFFSFSCNSADAGL